MGDLATHARGGWGVGEAFLLIHGDGIVDLAADFGGGQMVAQGVAAAFIEDAEGELVPDVGIVGVGDREDDFGVSGCERVVLGGDALAVGGVSLDDTGQFAELAEIEGGVSLAILGEAVVMR